MSLEPKHQSWQFPRYQQFNKWYYSGYLLIVQSGSGVPWSGAELLWSGRELTTKVGNNLGLSLCAVPRSAVMYVVTYFKRTELLPEV